MQLAGGVSLANHRLQLLIVSAIAALAGAGCLPNFALSTSDDGALPADAAVAPDAGAAADGGRYHPTGYAAADVHGVEMTLQKQRCTACHGDDLNGGTSGVGCDSCHNPINPSWRTTCTFCHGATQDQTGAPPRNLDGTTDLASARFTPHHAHVTSTLSAAVDCRQCHVKAVDVLSPNHAFDDTPGRAETDFGGGLSKQGTWDAKGTCANLYCHGDGRGDNGTISVGDGPRTCASCHPALTSGATGWAKMSGAHALHLGSTTMGGATCTDCHNSVTRDNASIATPALHVDGQRQVVFSTVPQAGFAFDAAHESCTGTCHGYTHATTSWLASVGARFHPAGYNLPSAHGPDMELQRQDCRGCHGATLTGGSKGAFDAAPPSCDSCHKPGWRTTCTYCHGGSVNQTGAPPRDIGAAPSAVSQTFRAHTAHVTQSISAAWDCVQCHVKPTDVLSLNHAFDATHGKAEVTMAGGLSPQGTYDGAGTCANLYCHGTGLKNGTYSDSLPTPGCATCHPGLASTATAWSTMSGQHRRHLAIGINCTDCHNKVTTDGKSILQPLLHVNGSKDVAFSVANFTYANGRCTGTCHNQGHNDPW